MSNSTNVNLRLDKELKLQAEQLFNKLGMNMTTAMNIFLRQAVREQSIPFKITAVPEQHERIRHYLDEINRHADYEGYITSKLQESELKIAEGKMKYYTEDDVFSETERIINDAKNNL